MAIVAVIAAALALALVRYRLSRLSDTEKQLVGEWTYPGRPIKQHVRFKADRTFFLWSSDGGTDDGTWEISGNDLTIFYKSNESLPARFLDRLSSLFGPVHNSRFDRPAETKLILDEISPTEIHLHTADGTKAVYQRGVAVDD
jgi:hypothetical protein